MKKNDNFYFVIYDCIEQKYMKDISLIIFFSLTDNLLDAYRFFTLDCAKGFVEEFSFYNKNLCIHKILLSEYNFLCQKL